MHRKQQEICQQMIKNEKYTKKLEVTRNTDKLAMLRMRGIY